MNIPKFPLSAVAALAAVIGLSGCEPQGTGSTTESGVVAGRILAKGNVPVNGASVILVPVDHVPSPVFRKSAAVEAVTDSEGRYSISGVPAGTYALTAAKDSLAAFRDSVRVPSAGLDAGADTLLRAGSLEGRVVLAAGEDSRTVLILVMGTNVFTVPRDSAGGFGLDGMGAGEYRVRFLSTLKDYRPLDTVLSIRAGGRDTLSGPVLLPFLGIAKVTGLTAVWDASMVAVNLAWAAGDSARVSGYNVYRAAPGAPFGTLPINPAPIVRAAYRDSLLEPGKAYAYAVKAVDKNGNAGPLFSASISVQTTKGEFTLVSTLKPEGVSADVTPLAVSGGDIFWLRSDRIDVYDTSGSMVRTIGDSGPEAIRYGVAIRVFGDTVYVIDVLGDPGSRPKGGGARIRKFTKDGQAAGGIDLSATFAEGATRAAADLRVAADGTIFATNGYTLFALRPGGKIDSADSPLDPGFRNLFAKLEPSGGKMMIMGSYRQLPGNLRKTQSALIGGDLKGGIPANADYFLNAYAGDSEGNTWIVKEDSLVEESGTDQALRLRIRIPEALYRDVQFEAGVLYLYDYTASAIRIYRTQ